MLTSRQEALITSIIQRYIQTAEPVSSRHLERIKFFGLKSATIRSEMNELENIGYLTHFHTSGGRVPTDRAYRYFVDNLLEPSRLVPQTPAKRKIKEVIAVGYDDPFGLNKTLARLLSELSDNLVITNISEEDDFFKVGLASLFELPDFREFGKAFRLANFFEEFEMIFDDLMRGFQDRDQDEVRIFIGRENPVKDVRDETVMFARYNLPKGQTGTLTLVGPTRMDYERNIGLVRYTAEELNKIART